RSDLLATVTAITQDRTISNLENVSHVDQLMKSKRNLFEFKINATRCSCK
ncbi:23562_t:CDS:1, partial [Racocetra persica]